MAVTKSKQNQAKKKKQQKTCSRPNTEQNLIEARKSKVSPSLKAFFAAALALPGLMLTPYEAYAADDDEVEFGYSHYQEGNRTVYGNNSPAYIEASSIKLPTPKPIEAESLFGHARVSLTDRVKFGFNFTQDTWAGATPIGTAPAILGGMVARSTPNGTLATASPYINPSVNSLFLDRQGNVFLLHTNSDGTQAPGIQDNRLTHVLSSASPETRQQGDFKLSYDWDNASVNVGGGISEENDYHSRFGNLGIKLDFNQKRTTVNWGMSYTNSKTHAMMDPIPFSFAYHAPYDPSNGAQVSGEDGGYVSSYSPYTQGTLYTEAITPLAGNTILNTYLDGIREDWGNTLGLTQVLSKNSLAELGLGFTHSSGFLSNPYKVVYVLQAQATSDQDLTQPLLYTGTGYMEARPHERNQITGNLGYQYYLEPLNAGLHFHYTFSHDNWGINSHTFDGDWVQPLGDTGWTVTPHVRYYSQSAANFYAPYLTTLTVLDPNTWEKVQSLSKDLPHYYSSDQRLSGFGTLSGGITITKQFAKGVSLQTGFEYYTHQGSLKLGAGGEQAFANFDYWSANAALKLNLGALHFGGGAGDDTTHLHHQHGSDNPAGVMFDHALAQAGDMMVGYRFNRSQQGGGLLHGTHGQAPLEASPEACPSAGFGDIAGCMMLPTGQTTNMHMLELMYAPTDWLTLMLMPQWMDMSMNMDSAMGIMHMAHHQGYEMLLTQHTGGIGDTGLYALFKLFEQSGQQLVLSIGGTAPTGAIDNVRRNLKPGETSNIPVDYGMQLGSGTWDAKPSLTYSGRLEDWSWGVQATGTWRLQAHNDDGYKLGDMFQSSLWGGYHWTDWLATTVREVYGWQGGLTGQYRPITILRDGSTQSYAEKLASSNNMPSDYTANYGGQTVDLGLGINFTVPSGSFAGHSLKFEWLQPVYTNVNGYQLNRDYTLNATWSVGF